MVENTFCYPILSLVDQLFFWVSTFVDVISLDLISLDVISLDVISLSVLALDLISISKESDLSGFFIKVFTLIEY